MADLFTKHLVSRDKVAQMVVLLGCKYLGGRAESAPQMRRTETGKTIIADADMETHSLEQASARMPHLEFDSAEALDKAFPSLSVPSDVGDEHEGHWDSWDKIFQRGQEIIEEITSTMATQGRRRCEAVPGTTTTTTTTATTTTTLPYRNNQPRHDHVDNNRP